MSLGRKEERRHTNMPCREREREKRLRKKREREGRDRDRHRERQTHCKKDRKKEGNHLGDR